MSLSKHQADAMPKAYVAIVCFKCFNYFEGMLQVLYIDITKVDGDVANVVMAIHVCFKCIFQMFHCSRRMSQVFCLDVAYICMLQAYVSSVFRCFIRLFAIVLLDIEYVYNDFQMFFRRFHKCFRCLF
jgi:hypothetical protein